MTDEKKRDWHLEFGFHGFELDDEHCDLGSGLVLSRVKFPLEESDSISAFILKMSLKVLVHCKYATISAEHIKQGIRLHMGELYHKRVGKDFNLYMLTFKTMLDCRFKYLSNC